MSYAQELSANLESLARTISSVVEDLHEKVCLTYLQPQCVNRKLVVSDSYIESWMAYGHKTNYIRKSIDIDLYYSVI